MIQWAGVLDWWSMIRWLVITDWLPGHLIRCHQVWSSWSSEQDVVDWFKGVITYPPDYPGMIRSDQWLKSRRLHFQTEVKLSRMISFDQLVKVVTCMVFHKAWFENGLNREWRWLDWMSNSLNNYSKWSVQRWHLISTANWWCKLSLTWKRFHWGGRPVHLLQHFSQHLGKPAGRETQGGNMVVLKEQKCQTCSSSRGSYLPLRQGREYMVETQSVRFLHQAEHFS